ncbi:hypothetical protein [Streptomyces sp. NPDC001137]|uniref:hypothetical protein n=1 Tax=Streptomyces sp. NPDC001137 TaxID=3154378 RepID=UPI00331DF62C
MQGEPGPQGVEEDRGTLRAGSVQGAKRVRASSRASAGATSACRVSGSVVWTTAGDPAARAYDAVIAICRTWHKTSSTNQHPQATTTADRAA